MKKYFILLLLIILIIFPLISINLNITKKKLILKNLKYCQMTDYTKENIIRGIFYFKNINIKIKKYEINQSFKYCDNIIIVNSDLRKIPYKIDILGPNSPFFIIELEHYFVYTIIKNSTIAGSESLIYEVHYLWLPWGWCKIKTKFLGGS